jgi:uncharacterized protein
VRETHRAWTNGAFHAPYNEMSLIIDGYNLINTAGIVGRGIGPGSLERSRLALLNFLAESLETEQLPHTIVVFDSHEAPWGMPRKIDHRGITVYFASQYEEADDMIEELIRADSAPRRLVVVSSDHRIQRAARRRRAQAVDSDTWYGELLHLRKQRQESREGVAISPAVPLLAEDVNYWLRQFGGESALMEFYRRESRGKQPQSEKPTDKGEEQSDEPDREIGPMENPFPPGYGEDLLEGL